MLLPAPAGPLAPPDLRCGGAPVPFSGGRKTVLRPRPPRPAPPQRHADHLITPGARWGQADRGSIPEDPHRGHRGLAHGGPSLQGPGHSVWGWTPTLQEGPAPAQPVRAAPGTRIPARACPSSSEGQCEPCRTSDRRCPGAWGICSVVSKCPPAKADPYGCGYTYRAPLVPRQLYLPAHRGAHSKGSPLLGPLSKVSTPQNVEVFVGTLGVVTAGDSPRKTSCPLGPKASPCLCLPLQTDPSQSPSVPPFP